jgi:hypothetical protein
MGHGDKGQRKVVKKPIPIACPDVDSAKLEGLIDLMVLKGLITEKELSQTVDIYSSYINALIDVLVLKGVFKPWELDICVKAYHDYLQAIAGNPMVPPEVLFQQRRNYEQELIDIRLKMMKAGAQGEAIDDS